MFRIPSFYVDVPTFDEAWKTMTQHGRGDTLEGMYAMTRAWEEYCASEGSDNARFTDDEDFFEHYIYEVNAYNVGYEGMSKLFGEAA